MYKSSTESNFILRRWRDYKCIRTRLWMVFLKHVLSKRLVHKILLSRHQKQQTNGWFHSILKWKINILTTKTDVSIIRNTFKHFDIIIQKYPDIFYLSTFKTTTRKHNVHHRCIVTQTKCPLIFLQNFSTQSWQVKNSKNWNRLNVSFRVHITIFLEKHIDETRAYFYGILLETPDRASV